MNPTRFDRISTLFAERKLSRRQALRNTGLAAAGAFAATGITTASAQDATPGATPEAVRADPYTGEKVMYLFVQSFQSGSIAPTEAAEDRYTVTLEQGLGQTIYFADRPSRDVGTSPTPEFLAGLGFSEDNPPNAALIVETESGKTDIAVVELFNPTYDEATHTATYEVEVLESWEDELDLGLSEAPADLATLAPEFGAAHLLIDDCSNNTVVCNLAGTDTWVAEFDNVPFCWNYSVCMPCEPYGHTQPSRCATSEYWGGKCSDTYPDRCKPSGCWPHFEYLFADC